MSAVLDRLRSARGARWVGVGAVLGAAAALAASPLFGGGDGSSGGAAGVTSTVSSPVVPSTSTALAFQAPMGTCLDWTAADAADVHTVDCDQPHLFESAGTITESSQGPGFPSDAAWRAVVRDRCTPLVVEFLGNRYDPYGRFTVGALKPSETAWRGGDRTVHCGVQVVARSGALYRTQGTAVAQDQADVHTPGTCLGIDGVEVGEPVDCSLPHAVEVVGVVDLGASLPGPDYPPEARQDEVGGPACTKLAEEYAGGPAVVADKKLTVFWDTLPPESWQAGTRKVDCKLGALLPDKSGFAPVTGSVRGPVTIGSTAAPPAPSTDAPGAPASSQPPLPSVRAGR